MKNGLSFVGGLASFRRRIIFRTAFVLLILATLALALTVLKEEKQRSARIYAQSSKKTLAEVVAKIKHPSGQLALLNPRAPALVSPTKSLIQPLLLPYSALDFADQTKAQLAVETVGCQSQYPDGSSLCVAIGNSARSGGFIYAVGSYATTQLVGRAVGDLDLSKVHRARITLDVDGETTRWIAPFEANAELPSIKGRFTGFLETSASQLSNGKELEKKTRPEKEFRAWVSQDAACLPTAKGEPTGCNRRTLFSIRLPVESYRDAIYQNPNLAWPPANLAGTGVRLELFAPDTEKPVFDSAAQGATPPFSWAELAQPLTAGETLTIRNASSKKEIITVNGADSSDQSIEGSNEPAAWWISQLIRYLPLGDSNNLAARTETVTTYVGKYDVTLNSDVGAIERNLSVTASRLSWFIGAMLGAICLAWVIIEIGLIRRIAVLTKRAAALSKNANSSMIGELDVADLRGKDELGILAGGLADLLARVKSDVKKEQIRAEQERDMWHAVGHEIMSPLQSLMVLHGKPNDPSHRYVHRMQQAVRVLYGSASPSEAIANSNVAVGSLDLVAFLKHVASNAHYAGIENVQFESSLQSLMVQADEYSLEDVVTHILTNAQRYREANSAIVFTLANTSTEAVVKINNQGPHISPERLSLIFEYGVSDTVAPSESRGQGLFVAKTYMAKMQGSIGVENVKDGVSFLLNLRLS